MPLTSGQVINNRRHMVKLLANGGYKSVSRAWGKHVNTTRALIKNLDHSPEAERQFMRKALVRPWIGQVCDVLIYLHSQNPPIIHRAIKPANIHAV